MVILGASRRLRYFVSRATPTIVYGVGPKPPNVWPTASAPGQNRCFIDSLTIAIGAAPGLAGKSRPATRGTPNVSKYPGDTVTTSNSTATSTFGTVAPARRLTRAPPAVTGSTLVSVADWTAGIAATDSSSRP